MAPRADRSDTGRSRSSEANLPLCGGVLNLCGADPRQDICGTVDRADKSALTRHHELDHTDHTDHTDQDSICPLTDLDHLLGVDRTDHVSHV